MDINVIDLDNGYQQCLELNNFSKDKGEKILGDLKSNIESLKTHWIGSDASVHINNLILAYNGMINIVGQAVGISSVVGERIIQIQEVRKSNGGYGDVGSSLPKSVSDFGTIANCESTTEYKCDPAASTDYSILCEIVNLFADFKLNFEIYMDELLQNWTSGSEREKAVEFYEQFKIDVETYKSYLINARDNLKIAIDNLAQL